MAIAREPIFLALLARMQDHASTRAFFKTFSRRLESWDDTPPTSQPAMMVLVGNSRPRYGDQRNIGAVWTLDGYLLVYLKDDGTQNAVVDPRINEALTAIDEALEMQPDEVVPAQMMTRFPSIGPAPAPTTLGGLCTFCRVSEAGCEVYQGSTGHQAYIRVPLEIEVPA